MIQNDSMTEELLRERKSKYGDTWREAGEVMGILQVPFTKFLCSESWMAHNWVLILSKLIRILYSPREKDHWRDIIGYATLVLQNIDRDYLVVTNDKESGTQRP